MDKKENKSFAIGQNFNLFDFSRTDMGAPRISETFSQKDPWILFGEDNLWPQELIRLFQNSDGLHAALVKRKVDMVAGMGFQDTLKSLPFVKNEYSKEDLEKVAYKLAFDLVLFGGYYLNIVWDANGQKIARIEHVPFEKVRIAKPTYDTSFIEGFYISRDWSKYRKTENKPYYICAFNNDDEEKKIKHPSQLLFVKTYVAGMDWYTLPSYVPITNYLKLSYEISTFHVKSVQNGYLPGLIVSIPHVPPAQEREKMSQEIKMRSGADEAGKTVVIYGESPDKMPQFTVLNPVTSDNKFKDLAIQLNENIYVGHNANNIIAGVAVAGKLGNSAEVKEAYAMFQATVITPMQENLEKTFDYLASVNGENIEFQLKEYSPYPEVIDNDESTKLVNAINSLAPNVANKVLEKMSDDEIRNLVGLAPLKEGIVIPSASTISNETKITE